MGGVLGDWIFGGFGVTHIVHEHRLNTILQGNSAGVTSTASTTKLKHNNSILEPTQLDITTILLDSGANASFEKFLDHANDLVILLVESKGVVLEFLRVLRSVRFHCRHNRLTGGHGLRDEAEDFRLDVRPVDVAGLGDGDEFGPVEDGGYAFDV